MSYDSRKPTAALMLKAPVAGKVKTRLALELGADEACAAYRVLVEHQLRQIPPDWKVVVHYDPPEAGPEMRAWLGAGVDYCAQVFGDLGARLRGALAVHDFCVGPFFLLGGDCPYLDARALRRAWEALSEADVVVGPALDGGYVLIGMKRSLPSLFVGVDWSTERVLEQTMRQTERLELEVVLLEPMEDVDDLGSWKRARESLKGCELD